MLDVFLTAGFEGGRHARRLSKIEELERPENRAAEPQETKE
jgi:ribose 5-phosphate isomerase RpiB